MVRASVGNGEDEDEGWEVHGEGWERRMYESESAGWEEGCWDETEEKMGDDEEEEMLYVAFVPFFVSLSWLSTLRFLYICVSAMVPSSFRFSSSYIRMEDGTRSCLFSTSRGLESKRGRGKGGRETKGEKVIQRGAVRGERGGEVGRGVMGGERTRTGRKRRRVFRNRWLATVSQ